MTQRPPNCAVALRCSTGKTPSSLAALVSAAQATRRQELPEALGPLALYSSPDCLRAIASPGSQLTPLRSLLTLTNRMETMSGGPYRAEHDQSSFTRLGSVQKCDRRARPFKVNATGLWTAEIVTEFAILVRSCPNAIIGRGETGCTTIMWSALVACKATIGSH